MENRLVEVKGLKSFAFSSSQNLSVKMQENKENFSEKVGKISSNNSDVFDKYDDPLMQWPMRGFAYTNELGVAISEIAPALGQALWIPTLMYLGADIYDKYKNDNTEYDPSKHRGVKQAVFQGLASVALPTCAVIAGQQFFSLLGNFSKSKLSLNAKEKISNYAVEVITAGHLAKYADNEAECKEFFKNGLRNVLKFKQNEKKLQSSKGFFMALVRNPLKAFSFSPKAEMAETYAEETITNLLELRKNLLEGVKTNKNLKWHNLVDKSMLKGVDKNTAVRDALVKFQKSQIAKGKWVKTLGGFIALGLVMKPIDNFVENVILKKFVEPKLAELSAVGK